MLPSSRAKPPKSTVLGIFDALPSSLHYCHHFAFHVNLEMFYLKYTIENTCSINAETCSEIEHAHLPGIINYEYISSFHATITYQYIECNMIHTVSSKLKSEDFSMPLATALTFQAHLKWCRFLAEKMKMLTKTCYSFHCDVVVASNKMPKHKVTLILLDPTYFVLMGVRKDMMLTFKYIAPDISLPPPPTYVNETKLGRNEKRSPPQLYLGNLKRSK
ncbi:hypothetical protein L9F63_027075, partial [Diploptera punctata]